jgi:hypothetical protein
MPSRPKKKVGPKGRFAFLATITHSTAHTTKSRPNKGGPRSLLVDSGNAGVGGRSATRRWGASWMRARSYRLRALAAPAVVHRGGPGVEGCLIGFTIATKPNW